MVMYEKQPILDKFQTVLNFFRHISYSIMTLFRGLLSSSVKTLWKFVTVLATKVHGIANKNSIIQKLNWPVSIHNIIIIISA